jgi:DNA-binding GntR family transcriptional regulator
MLEYKPLQNLAYEQLREMIYKRELQFGVVYSETRLASQLSISRTPIRVAINQLNRERYIDILPNRGFQLHSPDENDIREAYHVRMMIECYCGDKLAQDYQTPGAQKTLQHMQECLNRQAALLESGHTVDLRQFWLEDQEFHFAPLSYINISVFNLQYDSFLHIFMPQHLKQHYVLGRSESTVVEHQNIISSLRTGDVQKSREAIQRHLNTTLRLALSSKEPEGASQ